MKGRLCRTEVERALRARFGPTVRLAKIERAGVPGVQALLGERVLVQTFESVDPWRAVVTAVLPHARAAA